MCVFRKLAAYGWGFIYHKKLGIHNWSACMAEQTCGFSSLHKTFLVLYSKPVNHTHYDDWQNKLHLTVLAIYMYM